MLEVVFSDSAKGGLVMAGKAHSEIGQTIAIGFNLDVGDISGEMDGDERKAVFVRLFNSVEFRPSDIEHFFGIQKHDLEYLMTAAKNGEPIRVWKSDAAYSACGFACVCDLLRDIDCPLSSVPLPKYRSVEENSVQTFISWQEVDEDHFSAFLSGEKPIFHLEKMMQADDWQNLIYENAPLRAQVSGRLCSAPEDFYDFIIRREMPEDEIVMARLIGNLLGRHPLGVTDGWYALRIQKMIEAGQLMVTADRDRTHPYGKVIRVTPEFKRDFPLNQQPWEER